MDLLTFLMVVTMLIGASECTKKECQKDPAKCGIVLEKK